MLNCFCFFIVLIFLETLPSLSLFSFQLASPTAYLIEAVQLFEPEMDITQKGEYIWSG